MHLIFSLEDRVPNHRCESLKQIVGRQIIKVYFVKFVKCTKFIRALSEKGGSQINPSSISELARIFHNGCECGQNKLKFLFCGITPKKCVLTHTLLTQLTLLLKSVSEAIRFQSSNIRKQSNTERHAMLSALIEEYWARKSADEQLSKSSNARFIKRSQWRCGQFSMTLTFKNKAAN